MQPPIIREKCKFFTGGLGLHANWVDGDGGDGVRLTIYYAKFRGLSAVIWGPFGKTQWPML